MGYVHGENIILTIVIIQGENGNFYWLTDFCRGRPPARMRQPASASWAVGWPVLKSRLPSVVGQRKVSGDVMGNGGCLRRIAGESSQAYSDAR